MSECPCTYHKNKYHLMQVLYHSLKTSTEIIETVLKQNKEALEMADLYSESNG